VLKRITALVMITKAAMEIRGVIYGSDGEGVGDAEDNGDD
jgi:hypothetical protein